MKANELWITRATQAVLIAGSILTANIALEARAQLNVSVGLQVSSPSDFYTPLAPYGSWVDVSTYGRCWRPVGVAPGWRPYEIGHWEWTDVGWYWVSDDPWAWACYHYGSWELDPAYGWVWVPGTEWAPAWVVWRQAPDYVGWAPCGPGGFAVSDSAFLFVDVHHFHDRLEPREFVFNNPEILRRSRPVGGFRRETRDFDGARRQIAFNQGPPVDSIQRATGTRFTARPVTELVRQTRIPEPARRNLEQARTARQRGVPEQQPTSRTGSDQQRLYREPSAQPAPTGRSDQRIYREAPAPRTSRAPVEVPRRQPVPDVVTPPAAPQQVPRAPVEAPRRQQLPEAVTPAVPRQQPPATGRSEERIYREAPAPRTPQAPVEVPRGRQIPEAATPTIPRQQPTPPAAIERGRFEQQVPRREEAPPRAVPAPAQREPVAPPPPARNERDKQREGQ